VGWTAEQEAGMQRVGRRMKEMRDDYFGKGEKGCTEAQTGRVQGERQNKLGAIGEVIGTEKIPERNGGS